MKRPVCPLHCASSQHIPNRLEAILTTSWRDLPDQVDTNAPLFCVTIMHVDVLVMQLLQVVRTCNSASIYRPTCFANLANASLWVAYGLVSLTRPCRAWHALTAALLGWPCTALQPAKAGLVNTSTSVGPELLKRLQHQQ